MLGAFFMSGHSTAAHRPEGHYREREPDAGRRRAGRHRTGRHRTACRDRRGRAGPRDRDAQADAEIDRLREEIDSIDNELVAVVQRRIATSKQIQAIRMTHGGRRREHSRELKIVNTYVDALGREGSQLALTLLELSRGRA
jgi:chorismate mutase